MRFSDVRDDLRAALRSCRSSKSFTAAALVVLTLGIGATTAIFSVVDAVVLRGLPFDEHDRLVAVGQRSTNPAAVVDPRRDPDTLLLVAPQNYLDWVAEQRVFESVAAIASGWLTLREPGREPESLIPQRVTADFFKVLRVQPALGRGFTAENDRPGSDRVAVLSDGLWRRLFGGDPQVVGRTIPLEDLEAGRLESGGAGYEVIGVMPPGFTYPVGAARATDIWIPYVVPPDQRIRDPRRYNSYLQVIARLRPGVSLEQAQSQMTSVAAAIERANPVWNKNSTAGVRPLADHVVGSRIKSWMLMLLGVVAIVLLIACANLASLLLARVSAREREVAVRAALGASRWRLVRQFMVESFLLCAAGTVCAIVAAFWAVDLLRASMPDGVPRVTTIALDLRILAAAGGLTLLTTVMVGLAPALQLSKPNLSQALKDGARAGASAARQRLRHALVAAEVALAVVLLVGAALFIGSFASVVRIDPGFNPENVLTAQIAPRVDSRAQPGDSGPAFAELVERIGRIPAVTHASMVTGGVPLSYAISTTTITIRGKIDLDAKERVSVRRVTPAYHDALEIPLRRGRLFTASDRAGAAPVVIINETAARKYFPGEDPVGRTIGLDGERTVVGVVGDVRQMSLELDVNAEAFVPMAQGRVTGGELLIRTRGNPSDVIAGVKAAVFAVLPDVPLRNISTLEQSMDRRLAQRRLNMLLLGLFGLLGLTIAAVGIYGLMSYLVAERTREIGVRMALGASRSRVVAMVLINALAVVLAGLAVGSIAAWYVSEAARAFLFRLEPTDLRAFGAAMACLLAAATAASLIPARRAASVDPMVALRTE